jgi:hypothetical protein
MLHMHVLYLSFNLRILCGDHDHREIEGDRVDLKINSVVISRLGNFVAIFLK